MNESQKCRETQMTPASQLGRETQNTIAWTEKPVYAYVQAFYDLQKTRIMLGNRLSSFEREVGASNETSVKRVDELFKSLSKSEAIALTLLSAETANQRIYVEWLSRVRGVGPVIAAGLIASIGSIERFATVSKLWAYSGLAVKDGKAQRREKGVKSNWNSFLKTLCWKASSSFLKAGGYYRVRYDEFKAQDAGKHPKAVCSKCGLEYARTIEESHEPFENHEKLASHLASETQKDCASHTVIEAHESNAKSIGGLCKAKKCKGLLRYSNGHLHARAMRKTAKLFLSHLWAAWRELEGLPVSKPFALEHLEGHADYFDWREAIDAKKS